MLVIKQFTFDAAHFVPSYHGKCEKLHGHTYKLVVKVEGQRDAEGMVVDFAWIKDIVKTKVLNELDHSCLNEIMPVPTAENIAIYVWNRIVKDLQGDNYHLVEVEVWETQNNGCVYRGVE